MSEVSVVIPTYNRSASVCRAIESALNQTLPPSEVIIIDDGSTDDTAQVIAAQFGQRVTYRWQANQGVSAARNAGIRIAKSRLVAFLDSDDIWMPDKLARQVPCMSLPGVVLCATNWRWDNESLVDGFRAAEVDLPTEIAIVEEPLVHLSSDTGSGMRVQSVLCRRDLLLELGGFDSSFRITEDNDFFFGSLLSGDSHFCAKFCLSSIRTLRSVT